MLRLLAVALFLSVIGCRGPTCDPVELQARLDAAVPGDVVQMGACIVTGSFRVPAGVRLEGVGASQSAIEALPGNLQAIQVGSRTGINTAIGALRVRGPVPVLIRVTGSGSVTFTDLDLEVSQGTGIESAAATTIRNVVLTGPVNDANENDPAFLDPDPADVAVYGIVLDGVFAQLDDVTVEGFARAGISARRSQSISMTNGTLRGNLGYGLIVEGGLVTLMRTRIEGTRQGLRGDPSIAAALSNLELIAVGLELLDNDRYGLVQRGGSAELLQVLGRDNGDVAVWVGGVSEVSLATSLFEGGAFACVVIERAETARVGFVDIRGVSTQRRNVGSGGLFAEVAIGDGLHMLEVDVAELFGLNLENNERAGLVIDLAGTTPPTFEDVNVRSTGSGFGAIGGQFDNSTPFQLTPDAPGTWDVGITRAGSAADNDAALTDVIDALGAGIPTPPSAVAP